MDIQNRLDQIELLKPHVVHAIDAPSTAPEWTLWLEEIGFIPGEQVTLTARSGSTGPLAVRVGHSTFALRPAEAACIQVIPYADSLNKKIF